MDKVVGMKTPVRILHLDGHQHDTDLIRSTLTADGISCSITRVETRPAFISLLPNNRFDIIVADYALAAFDGLSALAIANKEVPHVPFVFFSGAFDEETAIECLRNGARDFVVKKRTSWLAVVVSRVLHEAEDRLERKRAEEALRASREYAQSVIDSSLDMIISVDMNRRIVEFNKAAEETFGYGRDEVLGQHVDLLYEKPQEGAHVHKTTLLQGLCVQEVLNRRKNGEIFCSLLSASLLRNSRGEMKGVMGVSREVTETKRTEEKMREQAALLDIAQDAILIQDLQGRITYWNKSAERVYGWLVTEALGAQASVLLHGGSSAQIDQCRTTCLESGEWRGELRQKTKERKEVLVESCWTLVRSDDKSPKEVFIVNTDITEKKKLESQLLRAQRIESIGTLAGGIAHDLNNVLTPILAGLQILKKKVADDHFQRLLGTLEMSAKRGTDIVKQVLTFARGADGEKFILQARHLIRELEKIVKGTFPKSIRVVRNVEKNLWTICADATHLHQVLLNLCVNARDAMPNGGTLTITAENIVLDENYARMNVEAKPGPHIMITVSDTGIGIPPGIIDKIFEPFFTTKEPGKGTGLGLATVGALVKAHRGFLHVYSEPGKGTTFKLYFPAAEAVEFRQTEDKNLELLSGKGEMILVVDDEESILEITRETLVSYGYRVLTATDGTEAVAQVAENRGKIDVVLTDMIMPFMDGPATIRAIRKIGPAISIVATSGLGVDGRREEAQRLGVEAFLMKPYTAETLLTTLREVVNLRTIKPQSPASADRESPEASGESPAQRRTVVRLTS